MSYIALLQSPTPLRKYILSLLIYKIMKQSSSPRVTLMRLNIFCWTNRFIVMAEEVLKNQNCFKFCIIIVCTDRKFECSSTRYYILFLSVVRYRNHFFPKEKSVEYIVNANPLAPILTSSLTKKPEPQHEL